MRNRHQLTDAALHELREPVQAIRGFLALVLAERAGPLTDLQRDFLATANEAAGRLERLMNDLDFVRHPSGTPSLQSRPVDLRSRVEACTAELRVMADELQMRFRIEAHTSGDLTILADPDRIDQILLNILLNALRYGTESEPIHIHLRAGRTRVMCAVENAISAETSLQNPREWFRAYTRQSRSRLRPGQGLGLFIVERLVSAHGGRIVTRIADRRVWVGFVLPRHLR